jgi:hypothetical protein
MHYVPRLRGIDRLCHTNCTCTCTNAFPHVHQQLYRDPPSNIKPCTCSEWTARSADLRMHASHAFHCRAVRPVHHRYLNKTADCHSTTTVCLWPHSSCIKQYACAAHLRFYIAVRGRRTADRPPRTHVWHACAAAGRGCWRPHTAHETTARDSRERAVGGWPQASRAGAAVPRAVSHVDIVAEPRLQAQRLQHFGRGQPLRVQQP